MKTAYLNRTIMDNDLTIGNMIIGEYFHCYTIERPWLDNKPNVSCIPAGSYLLKWGYYNAGQYPVYDVLDVPNRTLIKIHAANFADEIQGCIAPGYGVFSANSKIGVSSSKNALNDFHAAMGRDAGVLIVRDRSKI